MPDFRKYSTPSKTSYGFKIERTAVVSMVASRTISGWGSFLFSLLCRVSGDTECHGWPQSEPAESCTAPALTWWCESLENPSPYDFPNPFWFNCFKHAAGHSFNFELVKSEIKSEVNLKWCSYKLFLSYFINYLFGLYTWAYFTFWVDVVVNVKIISSSWTP